MCSGTLTQCTPWVSPLAFSERKLRILRGLECGDEAHPDRSLKGSIDEPLQNVVAALNKDPKFVTTSCCSGRMTVFAESSTGRKTRGKIVFSSHGIFTDATSLTTDCEGWEDVYRHQELLEPWIASRLSTSRMPVAEDFIRIVERNLRSSGTVYHPDVPTPEGKFTDTGDLWLNFEPFVIHIDVADFDGLRILFDSAAESGLQNSGLTIGRSGRMIFAARGAQRLHVPIKELSGDNDSSSTNWVSESYLSSLLAHGNKKLLKNWNQLLRFEDAILTRLTRRQSLPFSFIDWSPFPCPEFLSRIWGAASATTGLFYVVFGGLSGNPSGRNNAVHVLNTKTETWLKTEIVSLESTCSVPCPRQASSLVALGKPGALLLFGGRTNPQNTLNDAWLLSMVDDSGCKWTWEKILSKSGYPPGRHRHSMCCARSLKSGNADRHTVFVYGGLGNPLRPRTSIPAKVVRPEELEEQHLRPRSGPTVHEASISAQSDAHPIQWDASQELSSFHDVRIEESNESFPLDDLWELSFEVKAGERPSNCIWSRLEQFGQCPGPIHSLTLHSINEYVILFGGFSDRQPRVENSPVNRLDLKHVYIYHIAEKLWSCKSITPAREQSSTNNCFDNYCLFAHASCPNPLNDCSLLIVGGCNGTCTEDDVWELRFIKSFDDQFFIECSKLGQLPSYSCRLRANVWWGGGSKIIVLGGGISCGAFGSHYESPLIGNIKRWERQSLTSEKNGSTTDILTKADLWVPAITLNQVKCLKTVLETIGIFDRSRKIRSGENLTCAAHLIPQGTAALLPVTDTLSSLAVSEYNIRISPTGLAYVGEGSSDNSRSENFSMTSLVYVRMTAKQAHPPKSISEKISSVLSTHLQAIQEVLGQPDLETYLVPGGWEKIGDVVLFPPESFIGLEKLSHLWGDLAGVFPCRAIGVLGRVAGDKRESQCRIMFGGTGVVEHRENMVSYVLDVTRCMFSSGNGTERSRLPREIIAANHISGKPEIFVDMYCGIGYFTLPVLVKCSPEVVPEVWACDWNFTALEFLKQATKVNSIELLDTRLRILHGDSRSLGTVHGPDQGQLYSRATRISLGLIPDSEEGWEAAARLAAPSGCVFHVHGVARKTKGLEYAQEACEKLLGYLSSRVDIAVDTVRWDVRLEHLEKVKSYSPTKYHFVADILAQVKTAAEEKPA